MLVSLPCNGGLTSLQIKKYHSGNQPENVNSFNSQFSSFLEQDSSSVRVCCILSRLSWSKNSKLQLKQYFRKTVDTKILKGYTPYGEGLTLKSLRSYTEISINIYNEKSKIDNNSTCNKQCDIIQRFLCLHFYLKLILLNNY